MQCSWQCYKTCHPLLLLSKNLLFHTVHAHAKLDVTWVGYVLYISPYEETSQLREQSISTSGSLLRQWVSILLSHNRTIY